MTFEYREKIHTLSVGSGGASIIFESVVSGDVTNSATIVYTNPVYEGNLVKTNYSGQNWVITAKQKIYYSVNKYMADSLVLNVGESISWDYTKAITYYFEKY